MVMRYFCHVLVLLGALCAASKASLHSLPNEMVKLVNSHLTGTPLAILTTALARRGQWLLNDSPAYCAIAYARAGANKTARLALARRAMANVDALHQCVILATLYMSGDSIAPLLETEDHRSVAAFFALGAKPTPNALAALVMVAYEANEIHWDVFTEEAVIGPLIKIYKSAAALPSANRGVTLKNNSRNWSFTMNIKGIENTFPALPTTDGLATMPMCANSHNERLPPVEARMHHILGQSMDKQLIKQTAIVLRKSKSPHLFPSLLLMVPRDSPYYLAVMRLVLRNFHKNPSDKHLQLMHGAVTKTDNWEYRAVWSAVQHFLGTDRTDIVCSAALVLAPAVVLHRVNAFAGFIIANIVPLLRGMVRVPAWRVVPTSHLYYLLKSIDDNQPPETVSEAAAVIACGLDPQHKVHTSLASALGTEIMARLGSGRFDAQTLAAIRYDTLGNILFERHSTRILCDTIRTTVRMLCTPFATAIMQELINTDRHAQAVYYAAVMQIHQPIDNVVLNASIAIDQLAFPLRIDVLLSLLLHSRCPLHPSYITDRKYALCFMDAHQVLSRSKDDIIRIFNKASSSSIAQWWTRDRWTSISHFHSRSTRISATSASGAPSSGPQSL